MLLDHVWLLPAVSGAAFLLILFFGKRMPFQGKEVGIASIAFNFVLACVFVVNWVNRKPAIGGEAAEGGEGGASHIREPVRRIFTWYKDGNIKVTLGWHVDGFTVSMIFLVAFVSLMVHIFSWEYMRTDSRVTHYYAAVAL